MAAVMKQPNNLAGLQIPVSVESKPHLKVVTVVSAPETVSSHTDRSSLIGKALYISASVLALPLLLLLGLAVGLTLGVAALLSRLRGKQAPADRGSAYRLWKFRSRTRDVLGLLQ